MCSSTAATIRAAFAAAVLFGALPALAQTISSPTAGSTGGGVGSANLRNGFPAGGGAVVLPTLPNSTAGAGAGGVAATGTVGGSPNGGGRGGGGGGAAGNAGTGAASGSRNASGRGGGSFVLCPPSGASGEAAFLIGTDLSCAPR